MNNKENEGEMKQYRYLIALLVVICSIGALLTGCEDSDSDSSSSSTSSGDSATIIGTWTVTSTWWRWSKVTFKSDGYIDMTQKSDGSLKANKASWSISGGKLNIISDITEACSYTLTTNSLSITFPGSGQTVTMVK